MSPKHSSDDSKLTVTLTGLNLAVSIAREAADAVPVVKQTIGVVVRILALAEKIDKDREALHRLADRSLQLAQRVKDVISGRSPDATILASLERILKVFQSIETFMAKHVARGRLRRAIGYAFTVPLHVESLSLELADAVQELVVIALLDVNHAVHATHSTMEDNARYIGEFRLLRHCEVEKLETIDTLQARYECAGLNVVFYRAKVDGQVAVVRYFQGSYDPGLSAVDTEYETLYERTMCHDRILQELSLVQNSHRNVARIYGWSKGSKQERFTVFKSADFRWASSVWGKLPNAHSVSANCALKLLDAIHHLKAMGILWQATHGFVLDEQLEPMIGLQNDLYPFTCQRLSMKRAYSVITIFSELPMNLWSPQLVTPEAVHAAFADCGVPEVAEILAKIGTCHRQRLEIPKADLTYLRILGDRVTDRVIHAHPVRPIGLAPFPRWPWSFVLHMLDAYRSHRPHVSLYLTYGIQYRTQDRFTLIGMGEDAERIVVDRYRADIPLAETLAARKIFYLEKVPSILSSDHSYRLSSFLGTYHVI